MADADMIEASVDPGIMRIKDEDRSQENARYVPDVFFRYKNEYGLDVQKSAKPCFPVEYLLVNVRDFLRSPNFGPDAASSGHTWFPPESISPLPIP